MYKSRRSGILFATEGKCVPFIDSLTITFYTWKNDSRSMANNINALRKI